MANVRFRGESDFQKVKRDYEELTRKVVKLEDQNRKLASTSQKASRESTKANRAETRALDARTRLTTKAAGAAQTMLTRYLGMAGAIAAATAAMRTHHDEAMRASEAAQRLASGHSALAMNLGITDRGQFGAVSADVRRMNVTTRFGDANKLSRALGSTVSATGDRDLSKNLVKDLAPFFRSNQDGLEVAAGAAGDVATMLKGEGRSERSISLIVSAMNQARLTSMPFFSAFARGTANIAATVGPQGQGQVVEALALQSALSRGTKDPQGPSIASGSTALAVQLEKMLPEKDVIGVSGDITRRGTGLKTLADRIRAIQSNVQLQRQFFQGDTTEGISPATFEKKVGGVIKLLLTDPNSQVAREFAANQGLIKPDQGAVKKLRDIVNRGTPELAHDRAVKGMASIREGLASDPERLKLALSQEAISLAQEIRGTGSHPISNFISRTFENVDTLIRRDMLRIDPLREALVRTEGTDIDPRRAEFVRPLLSELRTILIEAQNANTSQLRELVNEVSQMRNRDNHRGSSSREMNRGRR
tara:strand:+ start:8032 stop:9633 length:1602 start_codon:yes stop_codon:yes gene_type:complete